MEYAKKVLQEELSLIKKSIKNGDWTLYKEALKLREKRCKDIEDVLKIINSKNK
jgi:hypothetical protein